MMVLFLVGLNGNVLLRLLLWWHRELFFSETTVGANVGGFENQKGPPNKRVTKESVLYIKDRETKNL
jgi:hypothetical protein